jgi:hypothetical protein
MHEIKRFPNLIRSLGVKQEVVFDEHRQVRQCLAVMISLKQNGQCQVGAG